MSIYKYLTKTNGIYTVKKLIEYESRYTGKEVSILKGFKSDGATFYWDLNSKFFIVHDYLKSTRKWSDGSHCSNFQASVVAFDILWSENRVIHAPIVFTGTLVWGYTKQLFKGLK